MSENNVRELTADEWDEVNFPRPKESEFDRVVERAISRRGFIGGVLAFGSGAAAMCAGLLKPETAQAQQATRFVFTPIPTATDSDVHVPEGYSWQRLVSWGDPLFTGIDAFDNAIGGAAADSDRVFGENTDGMELFVIGGKQVIAVNHEYTNNKTDLPQATDGVPRDGQDVLKLQNLQGIAVFEIVESDTGWTVVLDSRFNRRITQNTPMQFSGPATGHNLLKTEADANGVESLGTFSNCGSGKTPWGTYLTCEENFNGYFGATEEPELTEQVAEGYKRYGISTDGRGYDYHKWDTRFDTSKNPNEPHRAGWIVEIDPSNPKSTPVKRTALGRFKHENAETVLAPDGRVVVYMGDDERGEFLYKFVSKDAYAPGADTSTLLDEGQLYVARFHDDMTGEWLSLTPDTTGMSDAEIAIFSRIAASKVGATTMDRPEWVAVNPVSVEAYCALTNNSRRGVKSNAGGDWTPVAGPNPRAANKYGQIVRWRPSGDDHASETFEWDLYVMAGNPTVHVGDYAGSANINEGNLFNSPDGMAIDSTGLIWIQTDGDDSDEGDFVGNGNNQMLAGDPVTGRIERFLTGPKGAEVTGLCWSADRRTMFVGVQHPDAPFPDGEGKLPRSSIIAIKRDDNLPVG
ncbi:PhoX family phosphatase [Hoeflea sp. CAU 1731]